MKQLPRQKNFLQVTSKTIYLLMPLLFILAGMYSCNNKKSSTCNLTLNDSLAIAYQAVSQNLESYLKVDASKYEKISYLTFTTKQENEVFVDDSVMQIKFSWVDLGSNTWGLEAYGIDRNGVQKSGPVQLEPSLYPPLLNIYNLIRKDLYLTRGGLKDLFGLPTGTNTPIGAGEFHSIILSPSQISDASRLYKMYFDAFDSQSGMLKAINPSPPAYPKCATGCDN